MCVCVCLRACVRAGGRACVRVPVFASCVGNLDHRACVPVCAPGTQAWVLCEWVCSS